MSQLLTQLLLNASWATNKCGIVGIQLRLANDPQDINLRHHLCSDTFAEIIVADNGCGMDPVTLSRAMEPFFTTKKPNEGPGLGLSTADSVVRSWGGAIDITSEVGRGTQVHIFIPLKSVQQVVLDHVAA
jgi:signal transduction histidine kinase